MPDSRVRIKEAFIRPQFVSKGIQTCAEHGLLDQLREGITEAAEMICATSYLLSQHEVRAIESWERSSELERHSAS